jgi:hypothetical protein
MDPQIQRLLCLPPSNRKGGCPPRTVKKTSLQEVDAKDVALPGIHRGRQDTGGALDTGLVHARGGPKLCVAIRAPRRSKRRFGVSGKTTTGSRGQTSEAPSFSSRKLIVQISFLLLPRPRRVMADVHWY